MKYFCPVCGFKGLNENPEGLSKAFLGSYEICSCCGVEFGYEVSFNIPGGVENRINELREKWVDAGCPWFDESEKPKDWNLENQLANIRVTLDGKYKERLKKG